MFGEFKAFARKRAAEGLRAAKRRKASKRFREALVSGTQNVKINVGSGPVRLEGWINTDVDPIRCPLFLDLLKPWPIAGGSVQYVYADNVIEHLPLDSLRLALVHCRNAMASGGRIRLATPDLERTARAYLDDNQVGTDHMDRHRRHGYTVHHRADLIRLTYACPGHLAGYIHDFASLSTELLSAGFVDVHRHEAGESKDPNFVGLESRSEPTEALTELIVEAVRP